MCKFCDKVFNEKDGLLLDQRCRYSDDNSCELFTIDGSCSCEDCFGNGNCNETFLINGIEYDSGDYSLNISYFKQVGDLKIEVASERMYVNYCPICGKRLSKDITNAEEVIRIMHYEMQ